jgi:hypothetical protein
MGNQIEQFLKEVQMAYKYMKKFSTCLAIKKCKSKLLWDSMSPQSKWLSSRKLTTNAEVDTGYGGGVTNSYSLLMGM